MFCFAIGAGGLCDGFAFAFACEGMEPVGQRMLAVVVLMAIWWIGDATSVTVTALTPAGLVSFSRYPVEQRGCAELYQPSHFPFSWRIS